MVSRYVLDRLTSLGALCLGSVLVVDGDTQPWQELLVADQPSVVEVIPQPEPENTADTSVFWYSLKTNICRKYSRCLTARLSIKHRQLQEIIFESARYLHRRLIPWILIIQFNPDWALLLELVVGEFEAVILNHPSKLMPLNFTISVVIKQLQRFDHSLKVLTYL